MIRVVKRVAEKGMRDLGIKAGEPYYVLNYRKGLVASKNFPDRCAYTTNPWLKKLYAIDDAIYLFDATRVRDFKAEKNRILDMIAELLGEYIDKRDSVDERSRSHFVYSKRVEILSEWSERIEAIKPKHPLKKHLKKIRQQHPKLK